MTRYIGSGAQRAWRATLEHLFYSGELGIHHKQAR